MAKQLHVFGPTLVYYGLSSPATRIVGQSDGQALITIVDDAPFKPVYEDANGGTIPRDYIQTGRRALVIVTLIDWDSAVVDEINGAIAATSAVGTPSFVQRGRVGPAGMLRKADGAYRALRVGGTKITGANGGRFFDAPIAFLSPDANAELSNIGVEAARQSLVFECLADGNGDVYTVSNVT